jgi:hypothetical protein
VQAHTAIQLSAGPPLVLLADHLEGTGRSWCTGWPNSAPPWPTWRPVAGGASTWRSPTARAVRFGRTPGGHRIALYQLTRPELAAHFEGRRDFLPSVVLAGQVGYVVRLVLSRPERSYVVE